MSTNSHETVATFQPFNTFIDPSFWNEITITKVNEWQLDDSPKKIRGTIFFSGLNQNCLCLGHNSFPKSNQSFEQLPNKFELSINGEICLFNTKKEFEYLERKIYLEKIAKSMWEKLRSKVALSDPELLNSFYLTAFADIKNYVFYYWNCFPALIYPHNIRQSQAEPISTDLHELALNEMAKNESKPFLIFQDQILPFKSMDPLTKSFRSSARPIVVFYNTSSSKNQLGWTARNLLAIIAYYQKDWNAVKFLALKSTCLESFISELSWDPVDSVSEPGSVGWERDSSGKLTYRVTDLKSMFDPIRIMEQSVDLNLRLVKWQQAPLLDLQKLFNQKVLIIGSGTLGTNLARALLGWGIRDFTFLDCANVSYNNPIRQSLFTFEDCKKSTSKAFAAAAALKSIFPSVVSSAVHMKIPMPGHPYSEKERLNIQKDCEQLQLLIQQSDVIFIVMDSREGRWLPTLLSSTYNKLAITVALGFDSYVIIRHGVRQTTKVELPSSEDLNSRQNLKSSSIVSGDRLGCYFCNDVTAPGDSINDRTLDQQCTISRAGISLIASGLAVELFASVVQHNLGAMAPAHLAEVDENSSLLGATPHQIRGFVSRFHQMTPTVCRFEKCIACSPIVQDLYMQNGFDFLHRVFHNPTELERVTGLMELHEQANTLAHDILNITDGELSD